MGSFANIRDVSDRSTLHRMHTTCLLGGSSLLYLFIPYASGVPLSGRYPDNARKHASVSLKPFAVVRRLCCTADDAQALRPLRVRA